MGIVSPARRLSQHNGYCVPRQALSQHNGYCVPRQAELLRPVENREAGDARELSGIIGNQ